MDAAMLGAAGTIVVGLAAAAAAWSGHRGANRATASGAVMSGYDSLVNNLQEERDALQSKLADAETRLAAAYAELARERADQAALQNEISGLHRMIERLRQQISSLGGQPS